MVPAMDSTFALKSGAFFLASLCGLNRTGANRQSDEDDEEESSDEELLVASAGSRPANHRPHMLHNRVPRSAATSRTTSFGGSFSFKYSFRALRTFLSFDAITAVAQLGWGMSRQRGHMVATPFRLWTLMISWQSSQARRSVAALSAKAS